jgi:hypothetical protein
MQFNASGASRSGDHAARRMQPVCSGAYHDMPIAA